MGSVGSLCRLPGCFPSVAAVLPIMDRVELGRVEARAAIDVAGAPAVDRKHVSILTVFAIDAAAALSTRGVHVVPYLGVRSSFDRAVDIVQPRPAIQVARI